MDVYAGRCVYVFVHADRCVYRLICEYAYRCVYVNVYAGRFVYVDVYKLAGVRMQAGVCID